MIISVPSLWGRLRGDFLLSLIHTLKLVFFCHNWEAIHDVFIQLGCGFFDEFGPGSLTFTTVTRSTHLGEKPNDTLWFSLPHGSFLLVRLP